MSGGVPGLGDRMRRCSEVPPPIGKLRWPVMALALGLACVRPPAIHAHGEVHLRILALTQQIEAATNNPALLYLERGELEREHGLWAEAAADYDRVAELAPDLPGVDRCRAQLLADRGQLQAAQELFDRALQRLPSDGEGFVGRARVRMKLGQRERAIADYWSGLENLREPKPDYVLELAQALTADGQVEQSLRALDQGIQKLGPLLELQGYALELEVGRKNTDAALARLETILARALRKESWFAQRGDILREAGRTADARKSYEAALASVNRLPPRLQQSPAMVKLQTRVKAVLAGMTNAPSAGHSK